MLILTRRIGESIKINDDITVTVLDVKGHQVRLGVIAPKSVTVHREEIYKKIEIEKETGIKFLRKKNNNITKNIKIKNATTKTEYTLPVAASHYADYLQHHA